MESIHHCYSCDQEIKCQHLELSSPCSSGCKLAAMECGICICAQCDQYCKYIGYINATTCTECYSNNIKMDYPIPSKVWKN